MENEKNIAREIETYYTELHKQTLARRGSERTPRAYAIHNGFSDPLGASEYRHVDALRRTAAHVASVVDLHSNQSLLDQGCGVGSTAFHLATTNPEAMVVAANINLPQLSYGNKIKKHRIGDGQDLRNLHFCAGNYLLNPFRDRSFDRVLFFDSFIHSPDVSKTVAEAKRVTKPDGKLIVFDFSILAPADPQVQKFQELWMAPGLVTPDYLESIVKRHYAHSEITPLTSKILRSHAFLSKAIIRDLSLGPVAEGAMLLNSLLREGKIGYFQCVAGPSPVTA